MPPTFCADCGRVAAPGASFCTGCGRPVSPVHGGAPRPRRRTPWFVGGVLAALLVPVAVVSLVGIQLWHEREEAAQREREELVDFIETGETAAPSPGSVYGAGEVEEMPELVNREEVTEALTRQYPPLMRDAGVEGEAQVQLRVLPDGTVDPEHLVTRDASHPAFAEAAERVARRMRFRPGRVAGAAVTTEVVLPISFRITP